MKKLVGLLLLCGMLAVNTGCVMHSTGPNEVGVRTKKLSIFGDKGVEQKYYRRGSTYFFLPIINDWHTFDTRLQNIEMTLTVGKGDVYGADDLKFKTIDGNDISLDVIIAYRIISEKAPYILEYVARDDQELRDSVVRVIARSRPRDLFGELKTEEFYVSAKRAEKAEKAKRVLNSILNKYGIMIESVLTKDYRFNDAYQAAIEAKKIADQLAEQNKSATKAKSEEYKRKLEESKGEVNKLVAESDGDFEKVRIEADAYYNQQGKIAAAILAEGKAEAKGITAMNQALAAKGGKTMVKLKMAEALKGKRIFLLPSGSGNGLNLKTMDMNQFLQMQGVQKLQEKKDKKGQ